MASEREEGSAPGPVPAAFITDSTAPTGTRFRCTACGWEACSRVNVRKPSGAHYQTEFVSCGACRAMFHWIGEVPRLSMAPTPGAQTLETYMPVPSGPHEGVSEERLREIREAAERAQKGRSWRPRRR
jgi:transcription elongation factor Elf1